MFSAVETEDISLSTSHIESKKPHSNASSPADAVEETKQHKIRGVIFNMFTLFKELVFVIALALTTYGALHNSPSKVSKHPPAVRFFSIDSPVTDWYRGQLSRALTQVYQADVSFVMYYAPWDAECQYTRREFEEAATVLGDRVHFSAINCWNPSSECRLHHSKIPSWPIIVAYTVTSKSIIYRGPHEAASMIRFLELVAQPVHRVAAARDLVHLLAVCEAVAVAHTPLAAPSPYGAWYGAALRLLEADPAGEVCVAAVTSARAAADVGLGAAPAMKLMMWNETVEYDASLAWNDTAIAEWVAARVQQAVARVAPAWRKAESFARYERGRPLLVLFTPMHPLAEMVPGLSVLKEVAAEYYQCNATNKWQSELRRLQRVTRRLLAARDPLGACRPPAARRRVVARYGRPWDNTTLKKQKSSVFHFPWKRGLAAAPGGSGGGVGGGAGDAGGAGGGAGDAGLFAGVDFSEECAFTAGSHDEQCHSFEEDVVPEQVLADGTSTSMLPREDDPLSADSLRWRRARHLCALLEYAGPPPRAPEDDAPGPSVAGLACARNSSLGFVAMDSERAHHLAESLGLRVRRRKDRTAAVILDSENESQYILSEEYSAKSIREFIYNFTHKRLKRALRSRVPDAAHTHVPAPQDEHSVEILDLTSRSFRRIAEDPRQITLVAVCDGACRSAVSRSLADAARLLAACGARVRAARLDARAHDLPWHYAVQHVPAVLLLAPDSPGGGGGGGSLPADVRVSGGALAALALRALSPPSAARVRLALCARAKYTTERGRCLSDVKTHVTTLIGRNLRYWRRAGPRELRSAVLQRLAGLQRVSLHLSLVHVSHLHHPDKLQALNEALSALENHWYIDEAIFSGAKGVGKS